MLDLHCAQRRIKLVLPIPNYFKIYFCPNLTLSLKRRHKFKRYNAVKAFMKSQLYEILYKFHPTVDMVLPVNQRNFAYKVVIL